MIAKVVLSVIYDDIQVAAAVAGPLQLCAGQLSGCEAAGQLFGCEAAVHSMRNRFSSPDVEAVILIGALNAFNFLNH